MPILLNLDGGEHDDEPVVLYRLADVVNVACGGHAGDAASMARVVEHCRRDGTRIGAHPSYVDREGFGRRELPTPPAELAATVEAQCAALRAVSAKLGAAVTSAKLHGALYHAASRDAATAAACLDGIERALGSVAILGWPGGALEREAQRRGMTFLREAFADRGVLPDGTLVPRGQPGAVTDDPAVAAARTRALLASGAADTLCIHADTPAAVKIAEAVRAELDRP
jgi:UPF0271 protein